MANVSYQSGLREVADGVFAYLQPHGGWGLSNAGLLVDQGVSLLVDTLFDRERTMEMLVAMRRATPAARQMDFVVNTHANGDHCWGNELVRNARIIASEAGAREMRELAPGKLAALSTVARVGAELDALAAPLGQLCRAVGLERLGALLDASDYARRAFGAFRFDGIEVVLPSETFSGETDLRVGERRVELLEVGPAHTRGDVLVFVPDAHTVFTGDILFADAHPLLWEGPVRNWLVACDAILGRDVRVVVPGHGPVCDLAAVRQTAEYLTWIREEARQRFEGGLSAEEAAHDLDLGPYADWSEPERVVVNVAACYRELAGEPRRDDLVQLFGAMARWERARRRSGFPSH